MYCPKCGKQNPESGIYCRSCGTDLGNISKALATGRRDSTPLVDKKGKPIKWEGAISTFFTGLAFLSISIILAVSGSGRGWWFWMLIPAFACIGTGVAQFIQLRQRQQEQQMVFRPNSVNLGGSEPLDLPPARTDFVAPDTRYKTGDLVPPSVTEGTTRLLDPDQAKKKTFLEDDEA